MRIRLASASIAAVALAATIGSVSASGQSGPDGAKPVPAAATQSVSVAGQFATLKGVKAAPMAASELKAVKGLHVHFIDPHNGFAKVHLAGDVKTENNWSNLGGSDGLPVAPSYHGLCVAIGVGTSGISIPGAAVQCP